MCGGVVFSLATIERLPTREGPTRIGRIASTPKYLRQIGETSGPAEADRLHHPKDVIELARLGLETSGQGMEWSSVERIYDRLRIGPSSNTIPTFFLSLLNI